MFYYFSVHLAIGLQTETRGQLKERSRKLWWALFFLPPTRVPQVWESHELDIYHSLALHTWRSALRSHSKRRKWSSAPPSSPGVSGGHIEAALWGLLGGSLRAARQEAALTESPDLHRTLAKGSWSMASLWILESGEVSWRSQRLPNVPQFISCYTVMSQLLEPPFSSVSAPCPAPPHKPSSSLFYSLWRPALASSLDRGGMAHTWEQEPWPLIGWVWLLRHLELTWRVTDSIHWLGQAVCCRQMQYCSLFAEALHLFWRYPGIEISRNDLCPEFSSLHF